MLVPKWKKNFRPRSFRDKAAFTAAIVFGILMFQVMVRGPQFFLRSHTQRARHLRKAGFIWNNVHFETEFHTRAGSPEYVGTWVLVPHYNFGFCLLFPKL